MNRDKAIAHNRRAWDQRCDQSQRFTRPITDKELQNPKQTMDPWVAQEGIEDKQVLCLGAGGGRQGVLYAAAGAAQVMVVDISNQQLEADRYVAAEKNLPVQTLATSMDELGALPDQNYDIVIHPVSSCYVPKLDRVYAEIARVIKDGGLYVSQHKQPASMQAHIRPGTRGYELLVPYDQSDPLPEVSGSLHREPGTLEFIHTWEQLVGVLCRSGFVVEDLAEPKHGDAAAQAGTFKHRSLYLPPYVRIKARRTSGRSILHKLITGP